MKAFGYAKRQVSSAGLMEMREVTFSGSSTTIREIASFLIRAADQMDEFRHKFGHTHIQDDCPDWLEKWPDIIVSTSRG